MCQLQVNWFERCDEVIQTNVEIPSITTQRESASTKGVKAVADIIQDNQSVKLSFPCILKVILKMSNLQVVPNRANCPVSVLLTGKAVSVAGVADDIIEVRGCIVGLSNNVLSPLRTPLSAERRIFVFFSVIPQHWQILCNLHSYHQSL